MQVRYLAALRPDCCRIAQPLTRHKVGGSASPILRGDGVDGLRTTRRKPWVLAGFPAKESDTRMTTGVCLHPIGETAVLGKTVDG